MVWRDVWEIVNEKWRVQSYSVLLLKNKLKCKWLSYVLKCIYLYTKNVHRNIFNSKIGNNPNKRWCIHTMEYSTTMKMNKLQLHPTMFLSWKVWKVVISFMKFSRQRPSVFLEVRIVFTFLVSFLNCGKIHIKVTIVTILKCTVAFSAPTVLCNHPPSRSQNLKQAYGAATPRSCSRDELLKRGE